jgi:hypothetical protein
LAAQVGGNLAANWLVGRRTMSVIHTRHGIARTMPLLVLTGFAASTFAVLCCARPVMEPASARVALPTAVSLDDDCSEARAVPRTGIQDADGRLWDLEDIPGQKVRGLDLRGAQWQGADLHGATLIQCDFRNCDLTGANLDGVTFVCCHLEGAKMDAIQFGKIEFSDCYVGGARMNGEELMPPWVTDRYTRTSFEMNRTADDLYCPE